MAFIPVYILILVITILIDYFAGMWIEDAADPRRRRWFLIMSIISTCLVLFVFKYSNFFNANLAALAAALDWRYPIRMVHIILPIGLSFHTFQSLSYVIEVYRGRQKAERHFGIYALYVMFYPQLVAGPIERPQNLLGQFRTEHRFDWDCMLSGLKLMAWGLFKKTVIADRAAAAVNAVYNRPGHYHGFALAAATVLFAFQIYCDFSGYSDIAIGAARTMGFKLMRNFNSPYAARSISEFWARWHISLSTWFRDYLYIPLGGNRCRPARHYFNLMVTFLVSGLWHGADWTYVVWGGLNGCYLLLQIWLSRPWGWLRARLGIKAESLLWRSLNLAVVFAAVNLAWVFFRANSLKQAVWICGHLFDGLSEGPWAYLVSGIRQIPFTAVEWGITLCAIAIMQLVEYLHNHGGVSVRLYRQPEGLRWAAYQALLLVIVFFGVFNQTQFIYFQF